VRPMRALAVRLEPGRVAVVEVVESERGRWDRKAAFTEQVLGSSTTRERFPARVLIRTERGRVRVELGGTRHLFDVPELPVGFVGFRISGVGYVSLGDLKSSGGR